MDKRKGIMNVGVSVTFKIITMVMALVVKRFLIQICGNEINGLNALYLSIVGFLTVAELGVGSAITFCMYKPIVERDDNKVSALYHLFRRLYLLIAGVILLAGIALTPFIHHFVRDAQQIGINLYTTFLLMLISVLLTYTFSAKTALFNAYKNNYITTSITSGGLLLQHVLQIVTLIITRSFTCYLYCRILAVLVQWGITEIIVRKRHLDIIKNHQKMDSQTRKELTKHIKAMFMHKMGYTLVNTVDSIVISVFVGVAALGSYSNYATIQVSLSNILRLIFTSLTSVLGHLYVEKSKSVAHRYCEAFHIFNFVIGAVFFLGYYAIIDNLIAILFANSLLVSKSVSFVIALNGFVQFLRESTMVFRDATGTFYNDRWKPLIEGIVNLLLSIFLLRQIGVAGVIVATILTNLLICHIIEPYVLYKNAFAISPKKYYLRNYSMIALFAASLLLLDRCMLSFDNIWVMLMVNGGIAIGISLLLSTIVMLCNVKICKQIIKGVKKR